MHYISNNLIELMNVLKRYWLIIFILLILPVFINFLYLTPALKNFFEEPSGWTSIWAEYIGAIISTATAFIILYKQKEDNHV